MSQPHNYLPLRYGRRETPKRPPPISIPDNHSKQHQHVTPFLHNSVLTRHDCSAKPGKTQPNKQPGTENMRVRLPGACSKRSSRYGHPPKADIGCFYIVMDKGLGSAASLHSAGSRGGMFHFFLACPRIFRALLRSLVLRREETTRASSADWHGSEYFRCSDRECQSVSVGSPTLCRDYCARG